MGMNIVEKIISSHLVGGSMVQGEEAALRIDQTLTQDATGTMAYLEFESMGLQRVKTERSVAYIDHNTLQSGFENADDHRYIQSVAKKHGIWFSRPGNGICHQVHLERFGVPGKTLVGSDSHTPTAGGLGMLAFGAGGLDVAVAMGGGAYFSRFAARSTPFTDEISSISSTVLPPITPRRHVWYLPPRAFRICDGTHSSSPIGWMICT